MKKIVSWCVALIVLSCGLYGQKLGEKVYKEVVIDGTHLFKWLCYASISEYDVNGRLIHWKSSDGHEEWSERDGKGNLIYSKSDDGCEEWSDYDRNGNEIHRNNSAGYEQWYEYDAKGNMIHSKDEK